MKLVLLTMGLITTCLPSGIGATKVRICTYRATGEVDTLPRTDNREVAITLGTRLLLICDVTELSENNVVVSYRWFWSCAGGHQGRCEIRDGDPYYRVVNDTLLVDVTSLDHGKKYYCVVRVSNAPAPSTGFTAILTMDGNPTPFLYTPTSLLPEHSVLTDVQQATGRNGQQWITCRSGGEGTRPEIWMGSQPIPSTGTANSATVGLGTQHPNGLYHCLTAQSQREYFSLFLNNSVTLAAPTVSGRDTSMWTLTSPDGSRVERYIVELKCRVRNITFVEKYTSVSASGGTGRVATSVPCFGGLGQLYRVTVWAINGPSISRALVCTPGGKCREEEGTTDESPTTVAINREPSTTEDNTATLTTVIRATPTTPNNAVRITPTTVANKPTSDTDRSFPTPSGPQTGETPTTISTFIGVGVGIGVFLLLMLPTAVILMLVVVMVKRKASHKQRRSRDVTMNHNNTAVVEMKEQGIGIDYKDARRYQGVDNDQGEEDPFDVGCNPYEVVDMKAHSNNAMTPALKNFATPATVPRVDAVYIVVDQSITKGAKKKTEDDPTVINKDDLYTMPMAKEVKMTDKEEGVVVSSGVEEAELYI